MSRPRPARRLGEPLRAGSGEAGSAPNWRAAVAGKQGVEGPKPGVTSSRLPSLLPGPARRAVRLAGATGPQFQKSKRGKWRGGLNEDTLFKNFSPVKGPTPPSSRAGDLPQMRVAREAFPRPLTGGTLTPRLSRAP